MKPSPTGTISAKAEEMRAQGIHVYSFASGDPVLPNHPILIESAQAVLEKGHSPYAPVNGLSSLRKEAADWMNRRYKSSFGIDETIVTAGGKFAIYAALQILLEQGDEVLIPVPYWVSYPEMVRIAQGTPRFIQTRWKLTPELLKQSLTKKSRALILNNGTNPTGVLYTREEIKELLKIAERAQLQVISDEVYSEIVYEGAEYVSCACFPEYRSNLLIVESCSKNFAMPGWRVGFMFGPKPLIDQIGALQSQSTTGACFISQKVALSALKNSQEIASYVRSAMEKRRKKFFEVYSSFTPLPAEPPLAGMYYFDQFEKAEEVLLNRHVALVPGEAFGVPGYARFSFTETEEEIEKGLQALFQSSRSIS